MKATVILGPPGTGKTTALLNLVDEALSSGIRPEKIGFISFTKKSVTEARDRVAARFSKPMEQFRYFKTIHSLAFGQLGMSPQEVMQRNHYLELGESLGIEIRGYQTIDQEMYELATGDQMVFLESLSRLCREKPRDTYNRMNPDFSWEEFDLFIRSFLKYKSRMLLHDFTDMLEKFLENGVKPSLDLLFVDEAQDLCLLQWQIVEQVAKKSGRVYVAGDDDQAIFRWSGADVDYFINLARDNESRVLSQSYRLTKAVYKQAVQISSNIKSRTDKRFKPLKEDGAVEYATSLEDVDLSEGSWLILFRNGYMEKAVLSYLRSCGYSYEGRFEKPRESDTLQAAQSWEKLRTGKAISAEEAKIMLRFAHHNQPKTRILLYSKRDSREPVLPEELYEATGLSGDKIWHEALDKMPVEDKVYYIAARKRGETLVGKPRIKTSTIHGVKGGEEENVVIFTDVSLRTYKGMMNNPDDEARVFYVGVTRARKKLVIIEPQTRQYFAL